MTMADLQQPSSLEEVELLIQALYDPRSQPDDVKRINRILQNLQTSAHGWRLSQELSSSPNEHTQFFAALSFIVKLNTDWQSLSDNDAIQLLQSLVNWLCRALWPFCIKHLLASLRHHEAIPIENIESLGPVDVLLHNATPAEQEAILYFAKSLVEEMSRMDHKSLQNQHLHQRLEDNIDDVRAILAFILNIGNEISNSEIPYEFELDERHQSVVEEALSCYQGWAMQSFRISTQPTSKFLILRELSIPAMRWIKHRKAFLWAANTVIELLSSTSKFYTEQDMAYLAELITSQWGIHKMSQTVPIDHEDCDPSENTIFPQLVIAFAEVNVQHIAKSPADPTSIALFSMIHNLLTIPGYPTVDEDVSGLEFEFWSSLIELLMEQSTGPDQSSWFIQACKVHIFQAIQEYWSKIHVPPGTVLVDWTKDDKDGFQSFRKDFADLLETAYPLLHHEMFQRFVTHILSQVSLERPNWQEIESSLFCINSISDSMTSDPEEFADISALMTSPLFDKLGETGTNTFLRARLAGIALIGHYSQFFEQNPQFLAPALNFLFRSLPTPQLASQASKSIYSLCSSCRSRLTSELYTFIAQYQVFASAPIRDASSKERVVGAIGCIIQALPSEENKLDALHPILETIFHDFHLCDTLIAKHQREEAKIVAIITLKCLASLGKALQAPEDVAIVISDDEYIPQITCWNSGKGLEVQNAIATAVKDLAINLVDEIEVVDTACSVFKSGFSELHPGLLVFTPQVTTDFLLDLIGICSFYDAVIGTASSFVCSHLSESSTKIDLEAMKLKQRILDLVTKTEEEPDILQNILEFLNRFIPRYLHLLMDNTLELVLLLALNGLSSKEQFTKKAAATFWTSLLNAIPQDERFREQVIKFMWATPTNGTEDGIGLRLAQNLLSGIGGEAARSELDWLSEPLKKLVFRFPPSKAWLESALFASEGFPSPKLSRSDKQLFLNKLFTLRGGRGTNQVVKEFWMKARGINFDYAS